MRRTYTLRSRGKTLELGRRTCIMGIVNITPDSFYDGGRHFSSDAAIEHTRRLIDDEADIVDLGAQSTRPGSQPVGAHEELQRILPVISKIRKDCDAWISVDTYRSEVARVCLQEGADMINDVSSFRLDREMPAVVAEYDVPVVCMHFKDSIHPMPADPQYQDLFGEILSFFRETLLTAEKAGIRRERIIVDPGIGFGKQVEHNLRILNGLSFLKELDRPVLAGPSRKSFIGKLTGLAAEDRLEGTAAAVGACVQNGAQIIRVHDAGYFRRYCDVLDAILCEDFPQNQ